MAMKRSLTESDDSNEEVRQIAKHEEVTIGPIRWIRPKLTRPKMMPGHSHRQQGIKRAHDEDKEEDKEETKDDHQGDVNKVIRYCLGDSHKDGHCLRTKRYHKGYMAHGTSTIREHMAQLVRQAAFSDDEDREQDDDQEEEKDDAQWQEREAAAHMAAHFMQQVQHKEHKEQEDQEQEEQEGQEQVHCLGDSILTR